MIYFLVYHILNRISYNNKAKFAVYLGTLGYMILLSLYNTVFYSLIIPIDITTTLYYFIKSKGYLKLIDTNDNIKTSNINTEVTNNLNNELNSELINKLNNEIKNNNMKNEINDNINQLKYIPYKLNIHSSLQQTVQNLGL